MRHPIAGAAAALAAVGGACFCWGLLEAHLYTLRRVTVPILGAGSDPIRILHLSDLHLAPSQRKKLAFVRGLAALSPHLVINTGDNITRADAIGPLLDALAPLAGVPGAFVFGSNDYHAPQFKNPLRYLLDGRSHMGETPPAELPWRDLKAGFEALGWADLTEHRVELEVAGRRVALRGTDDAHLGRDDYAAVAGPADASAALNIGVTHAPYLRILDAMAADGMDLIFAGHTHGGQVCVPGYGALITNCDLDPARVKGLSTHEAAGRKAALHVSGGLGASPFAPYRFANRPEATLLTLTAAPEFANRPTVG